ncbi:MAG: TetR/AcrR family transcriptional regulator [Spirochaetales bacterium]|nr:TetR/AcrR family transcriptional regulator [Spirochaetales bacterium]
MPRKTVIFKKDIINAAVELVRSEGHESLNSRALAKALGCSTQPIFSNFSSMDDVMKSVLEATLEVYNDFVRREFERGSGYPPYKTNGMAYIRFAMDEKNLFRLLFMRDRTNDPDPVENSTFTDVLPLIMKATGLSEDQAALFHLEMWTCVHGIAVMAATSYYKWDEELASRAMTDTYQGLIRRFREHNSEANDEERH